MVISIMGRDGTGKSNLAAALARLFAEKSLTGVINTDLTMPTTIIPSGDVSLGNYLFSGGRHDLTSYLHQDMRTPTLFWAGTAAEDDIYSFETYLSYHEVADSFIASCIEDLDNVIIDLSGQRVDPFLHSALVRANYIIVLATCDPQGVNYLHSIKRLLKDAKHGSANRIKLVAAMVMPYQDTAEFEKVTGHRLSASLPHTEDIIYANTLAQPFLSAKTKSGQQWQSAVKAIYADIIGGGGNGS